MPLTSSISTSGNTLLIGHSPIPLWSYEDFTQYPKVGYGGLDQDQADLREQVLKVSGEGGTSIDPTGSLRDLSFLTFTKGGVGLFSLDEKKTIFDQFGHIARIGHVLISSCNTGDINNLSQHRTNIESTITYVYNSIIGYENNLNFLRELTLCRSSFIRNDICVLLISFVEYLCLSADYDAARKWHTQALKITQMLSAPQYYIELMRDLYVRFPEYMEPSSDIQTSAHHGQVFTTALDKTFYEKEVHLEVTNPKGGTSKVLDEVAMKERRMRSQRNHNQSDLLSILAYFRTWRTISGTVGDLQAKISEFDRMKDGYIRAISESGKPYSATYEIGDAIMLHKIEHSIAQCLSNVMEGGVAIDPRLSRYTSDTFWLPDISSQEQVNSHAGVHERSIIFWEGLRSLRVDLRIPMIQSLMNSTRYSSSSSMKLPEEGRKELRYRIAKMIAGRAVDFQGSISDYLLRHQKNPEINLFTHSGIPQYTAEIFPSYLAQLLLKENRIIRELLSECFLNGEWTLVYHIARGAEQVIDTSDPMSPGEPILSHKPQNHKSSKISLGNNMFLLGKGGINPLMLELLSNTDFHQLIVSAYQSIREARLLKVTQVALSERDTALQLIALFRREVGSALLEAEFGTGSDPDSLRDVIEATILSLRQLMTK